MVVNLDLSKFRPAFLVAHPPLLEQEAGGWLLIAVDVLLCYCVFVVRVFMILYAWEDGS